MLKSLHQLQEENRRLEEQIKTLTMKKERLQLLSAQLSVPFTPSTTSAGKHTNFQTLLIQTVHFIFSGIHTCKYHPVTVFFGL